MIPIFSSAIVLILLVFWAWMFRDFAQNPDIEPHTRQSWLIAFIVLSVATAFYYYLTVYRERE